MVITLTEARELELLALAYTFGGLAPGSEAYESWFRRSFAMLDDILEDLDLSGNRQKGDATRT